MTVDEPHAEPSAGSPSSRGPGGSLFEGQVGAHYLLTMLAEADPRGMPGVLIEQVRLQCAGEGFPLDDIVIHGITKDGLASLLEIQVKRTITFSPGDLVFRDVVKQLARALPGLEFSSERHQFAVATERTSFKIAGPYQDVLRWAREVGSATVFMGRINRKHTSSRDMRTFVATMRTHLEAAGCTFDDETVWQVLRRFQILTFDYDAPGSQAQELALERIRNLLDASDASRASALWKVLTETAIRVAASGGDLDRAHLLSEISSVDGFRLAGSRSNRAAREMLAEAASLTAANLRREVAGVSLARSARLDEVRDAQDKGRYIEIRGSPGVGKSGLLGMLVDQVLAEGRAIVLTPERTPPGGWLALKPILGIETGLQEFLTDLASDGGAALFIDSLDFFEDSKIRATVVDVVRAVGLVPDFRVFVTARTDFDNEEPNWIPGEILARLGRAPTVIIDELGPDEVEELRTAAPSLSALLADDHPARPIARNLFHLSRLLEVQGSTEQLQSEVDLLEHWWNAADGPMAGRRDRLCILRDLADIVLAGAGHVETRAPSSAVDALIHSETLLELGPDQFTFRHDVLREWAVASRLRENPDKIQVLELDGAVPMSLARGVELGARFALERAENGASWTEYLEGFSPTDAHPSWRRWALLAILRSETAFVLLDRGASALLANEGVVLRELIRTALAVESRPLAEAIASTQLEVGPIPPGINSPSNRSWAVLAVWLLKRQADLPLNALRDVVDLFQSLSASMFFLDHLTPQIAATLADWLVEIEEAEDHSPRKPEPPRFTALSYGDLAGLATVIRHAFFLMAARTPQRAQGYLRNQLVRRNSRRTIREIMKFCGTLAQAAPAELADLTLAGLIQAPTDQHRDGAPVGDYTFTHLDSDFLPSSPAQGPFLDLLKASPEHGLRLIRRLVEHAVSVRSRGADAGDDGFMIELSSGPRFFPWRRTYLWSRRGNAGYALASGLLALEGWAHGRLDRGDAIEEVIADVLGQDGSPAAFLQVTVDLLISHWPKTMAVAIPFLGSPELLSFDRDRQLHDSMANLDLLGLGAIGPKEPRGTVGLEELRNRPSRRFPLESLLSTFVKEPECRDKLRTILESASDRLGAPEPGDSFADARLMARYALNVIDPANWRDSNGARRYVSPPDERRHLEALQRSHAAEALDSGVRAAIQVALKHPKKSGAELVEQAIPYAQRLEYSRNGEDESLETGTDVVVSAALLLARDGTDEQLNQYEDWARNAFDHALATAVDDGASAFSGGIMFNPVAIATLGLIHLWRRGRSDEREALLQLAGREDVSAAHGFGTGLAVIHELDPRLSPALLRCVLHAQIFFRHNWDTTKEEEKEAAEVRARRVAEAISAEVAWLGGTGAEPAWPALPPRTISIRRGTRVVILEAPLRQQAIQRNSEQLHSQTAAIWVRQLTEHANLADVRWLSGFVEAYASWTADANGKGLDHRDEIEGRPDEWNGVFYPLMAHAFVRMPPDQIATFVAEITALPDASFFDIIGNLVPALDEMYFNELGMDLDTAVSLRTLLCDRLMESAGWLWERERTEMSVEMTIGPAIAPLFFCHHNPFTGSKCYLLERGIDQVDAFLPLLTRLISEGSVPFIAVLTMNLLEVSPKQEHLPFLLSSGLTWLRRQPQNRALWIDHGLGARVVKWLDAIIGADVALRSASHPLRPQVDDLLGRLVQVGVAEAHHLELILAKEQSE